MKPRLPYWLPAACSVALGSVSTAQVEPQPPSAAGQKQGSLSASDLSYRGDGNRTLMEAHEDYTEMHLLSGFRFVVPGLKLEVAETAMQYNIQQVDRRISAHNYRALWKAQDTLQRLGVIKSVFDVNKHIEPKFILDVMKTYPDLFSDLQPIPEDVAIKPGYVFKP